MLKVRSLQAPLLAVLLLQSMLIVPANAQVRAAQNAGLIEVHSESWFTTHALMSKADALFKAQNYEGLEMLADQLRNSKQELSDGYWLLDTFYEDLKGARQSSEQEWQNRLAQLNAWVKAKPQSATARIVLGDAMIEYAWKARSDRVADQVSDAQWKTFKERIVEAHRLLSEGYKLNKKCPHYYASMLIIALAENWDLNQVDQIFNASILAEPKYRTVYVRKATCLLPRWSGKEGAWEKFAKASAEQIGGTSGAKLYAQLLWDMYAFEGGEYQKAFDSGLFNWAWAKRGFQQLMVEHPKDIGVVSKFASMSVTAGDRAQANQLFKALGNRVVVSIWQTTERFQRFRNWAMSARPQV